MRRTAISVAILLVLTGLLCAQNWAYGVQVFSGDRTADRTVVMGVDTRGTDCFDHGLDSPLIPGSPGAYLAFFVPPCTEGLPPEIDYLSVDVRIYSSDTPHDWVIRVANDVSPAQRLVQWVVEDLPMIPEGRAPADWAASMLIGYRPEGTIDDPLGWENMEAVDTFLFPAGNEVVIRVTLEGADDVLAPWIEYNNPPDSAVSCIDVTDSITFDIVDDIAGVDLASVTVDVRFLRTEPALDSTVDITALGVFTTIIGGYHFRYDHAGEYFPLDAEVYVTVNGQDLAVPDAHVMEPFEWYFQTCADAPGDTDPPTFEWLSVNPDIEDTIGRCDAITLNILDYGGVGVDVSTIVVTIDGDDRTEDCLITNIGLSYDYNVIFSPILDGCWDEGVTHTFIIESCDFVPNCADPETVRFYIEPGELPAWEFNVSLEYSDVPSYLKFGMDEDAESGKDDLDQIAWPMPIFYSYFPLVDPVEMDTMLSWDIRPLHYGNELWEVRHSDATGDITVEWEPALIPDLGVDNELNLYIGYGPDEGSLAWFDMSGYSEMIVDATDMIFFKASIGFGDQPPSIVNLNPPAGADDVDPTTNICFDVIGDYGIDLSSLVVTLNTLDITSMLDTEPLALGYRVCYNPPGVLETNTTYDVSVHVSDFGTPVHTLDTLYWFTTADTLLLCAPEFELIVTANDDADWATVTIGTDADAEYGFDALDYIAPPPIAFGVVSLNPDTTELDFPEFAKDMRYNCVISEWKIRLVNQSGASQWLSWNMGDIPYADGWCMLIAAGTEATPPADEAFVDMAVDTDSLYLGVGQIGYIRLTTACGGADVWTVTGEVTNCLDGLPIEGIQVSLAGLIDYTLADGSYEFPSVEDGLWPLSFTDGGGYYQQVDTGVTVAGANAVLDICMSPFTYEVSGVTSLDGVPTSGITLYFNGAPVVSGIGGAYSIDIEPGDYEVTADEPPCYGEYSDSISVTSDMTHNVNLVTSEFTVSGFASLAGVPSAGITISVAGVGSDVSDDSGYYEIPDVPCALHNINATYTAGGYEDIDTAMNIFSDMTVDFNLPLGCVDVTVDVTLEGAADNSGALVQMPPESEQVTPPSGTVEFTCVSQGDYTISVTNEYFAPAETLVNAVIDVNVDIFLCYYWPAEDLDGDFYPISRPLDDVLAVTITWTEPTSACLTVLQYHIYKDDFEVDVVAAGTAEYVDYEVYDGESYSYYVVVEYDDGGLSMASAPVTVDVEIDPDPSVLLLIDFDNGAGFADDLAFLLESIDVTDYTMTEPDEDISLTGIYDLDDYNAVFVVLGIDDAVSTLMSVEMQDMLEECGEVVYICGPDFAQDYAGSDLLDEFRFSATDGEDMTTGNVQFVKMAEGFYGSNWVSDYDYQTEADHYVDDLAPLAGATAIIYANEDNALTVGVKAGSRLFYTSVYMTAMEYGGRFLSDILARADIFGSIEVVPNVKPGAISVAAYPNPFNAACGITIDVPVDGIATLAIYDISGNLVKTLHNGSLATGRYSATWNAEGVASGVYVVSLKAGSYTSSTNITLIK